MSSLATLKTRIKIKLPGGTTSGFVTETMLNQAINRTREFMYSRFSWPHLKVEDNIVFASGSGPLPSDFKNAESLKSRDGATLYMKVSPDKFDTYSGNIWTIKVMSTGSRTGAASPGGFSRVSNVVTATTTAAHPYEVGDQVAITGATAVGATSFNGTFTVTAAASSTTFTFASTAADDTGGAGTIVRTNGQKRAYIKPNTTTDAILRYYQTLTDLSAEADDSGFPGHLEEAILYGVMKFISEADKDPKFLQYWGEAFYKYLRPIHSAEIMQEDGYEHNYILSGYDDRSLLFEI